MSFETFLVLLVRASKSMLVPWDFVTILCPTGVLVDSKGPCSAQYGTYDIPTSLMSFETFLVLLMNASPWVFCSSDLADVQHTWITWDSSERALCSSLNSFFRLPRSYGTEHFPRSYGTGMAVMPISSEAEFEKTVESVWISSETWTAWESLKSVSLALLTKMTRIAFQHVLVKFGAVVRERNAVKMVGFAI